LCFFTPVANQVLSFLSCHLLVDNQPNRLVTATATLSEVPALDPPHPDHRACRRPYKGKQTTCIPPDSDSFALDFVFFQGRTCSLPQDPAEPDGRPWRRQSRPGSLRVGRTGQACKGEARPPNVIITHSDSSELIVSITDSPTHTYKTTRRLGFCQEAACSLLCSRSGHFIFQLSRLFHQDITGLQDVTGHFQAFRGLLHHRMLRHMESTRESVELASRSCSPVSCLRSNSEPPSLGRTPRSQPSGHFSLRSRPTTWTIIIALLDIFLHQPGRLALISTTASLLLAYPPWTLL
jgi:hypothetical protein